MNKNKIIKNAIAGVVAVGLSSLASQAMAGSHTKGDMEKCYGVVKSGKNDCGTKSHSCAGQAKEDNSATEWVMVPKGLCDKLAGGSTSKPEDKD